MFEINKSPLGAGYICTFEAIPADDKHTRAKGDVIVSCLYWAERDDYFITSVDMVYLFEKLMLGEFNQEDKNRVRRNLEVLLDSAS
jgi:hypothetical protein